ncbi:hypothetical protein C7999DRAFT_31482 [Corynascus novoguineensis]|uniref:Uncharacterized protein n=1 Tax=Corynascus novoguineensis TaxID=1126955 RepID=A0AAN7CVK3_9PEZI|nr:hypothetical protein C7999DRAFT_31482 [Corynascus novoguineensis]
MSTRTVTATAILPVATTETKLLTATRVEVITVIDPVQRTQTWTTTATSFLERQRQRLASQVQALRLFPPAFLVPLEKESQDTPAPPTAVTLDNVGHTGDSRKRAEITVTTTTVTVTTTVSSRKTITATVTSTVFSTTTVAPNAGTTVTVIETVVLPWPPNTTTPPTKTTATSPRRVTSSASDSFVASTTRSHPNNLPTTAATSKTARLSSSIMTTILATPTSIPTITATPPPIAAAPPSARLTTAQLAGIAIGAAITLLLLLALLAFLLRRRVQDRRRARAHATISQQLLYAPSSKRWGSSGPPEGPSAPEKGAGGGRVLEAAPAPAVPTGPGPGRGRRGRPEPGARARTSLVPPLPTDSTLSSSASYDRRVGLTSAGEVRVVIRQPPRAKRGSGNPGARNKGGHGGMVDTGRRYHLPRVTLNSLALTPVDAHDNRDPGGSDSAGWSIASQRGSEVEDYQLGWSQEQGQVGEGRGWNRERRERKGSVEGAWWKAS